MNSDARLRRKIAADLLREPRIDATRLKVEVRDGRITISGTLRSFAEQWYAEHALHRLAPVGTPAVALKLSVDASLPRTDLDLERSVRLALTLMVSVPKRPIHVIVDHGSVTLSGEVEHTCQRQLASSAVSGLVGVRELHNSISVRRRTKAGQKTPPSRRNAGSAA